MTLATNKHCSQNCVLNVEFVQSKILDNLKLPQKRSFSLQLVLSLSWKQHFVENTIVLAVTSSNYLGQHDFFDSCSAQDLRLFMNEQGCIEGEYLV